MTKRKGLLMFGLTLILTGLLIAFPLINFVNAQLASPVVILSKDIGFKIPAYGTCISFENDLYFYNSEALWGWDRFPNATTLYLYDVGMLGGAIMDLAITLTGGNVTVRNLFKDQMLEMIAYGTTGSPVLIEIQSDQLTEPRAVYIHGKRAQKAPSLDRLELITHNTWYFDTANKKLVIKAYPMSPVPILVMWKALPAPTPTPAPPTFVERLQEFIFEFWWVLVIAAVLILIAIAIKVM